MFTLSYLDKRQTFYKLIRKNPVKLTKIKIIEKCIKLLLIISKQKYMFKL